ncbi:hypothetical protein D9M73_119160 [compost metagenome]
MGIELRGRRQRHAVSAPQRDIAAVHIRVARIVRAHAGNVYAGGIDRAADRDPAAIGGQAHAFRLEGLPGTELEIPHPAAHGYGTAEPGAVA